jgi:xanthine dehydrogenase small subunit
MTTTTPTSPVSQPIRFWHRGAVVTVDGVHPTRSVLDWLREDARCTGTKEGCNEGDCGACTVVVGELAETGTASGSAVARATRVGGLSLRTVNACMQFLPTLHGRALFTVQDLAPMAAAQGAERHPVQQAMVDCHGSQCGFCTPGFVMSLWSVYERFHEAGRRPTRQQLADELSGNLCRCTGYRPILDAGERMFDADPVRLATAPAVEALRQMAAQAEAVAVAGADAGDPARPRGLVYAASNPMQADASGHPRLDRFIAPRTLEALADAIAAQPEARLLAGSTDIGLWVTKQFRDLGDIIFLGDVAELRRIEVDGGELVIGAGASLEDAWSELALRWPTLTDVGLRFASPPIRNAGTMGGNVANGSPIGDSAPVLMALDARAVLRRGGRLREMPLADFYLGYMKNQLEPGEFVQALRVPLPVAEGPGHAGAWQVRAYKISKRFDCDISALCAGLAIRLDAAGTVTGARWAFGGMAATVARARRAEAAVLGQAWAEPTVEAAMAALAQDFTPLTDLRASASYRQRVAQNLLRRLWLETRPMAPLASHEVSVFAPLEHEVLMR